MHVYVAQRSPDHRVGATEPDIAGDAEGGGEVGDAGVSTPETRSVVAQTAF